MSTSPPSVVADRYRLVAPLGQGGMGRVWRATDVVLHRDVAIKELVPPPGLTAEERQEMRERSLREARAIARLNNVNVVRVFDVLRTDADPWIVMEYVASRSLQDVLASDGPYPATRAAEIGLGVLGALRAAHRAGVVHRDVKPGNVLIGEDGRVVLTDFGLATVPGDPNVTRTGLVLGSPAYIAPERARDGTAGPGADLWSLGATLYAAVEGASPFARPSAIATLAALATENPPPARNAGPLKPVLNGLLRKDPAHRINAEEAERLLLRATGRRSKISFPMSATMRRPGLGRDRPAGPVMPPVVPGAPTASGSAPVVPGPRPPVSTGLPGKSTGIGRAPVYTPGKASVGKPAASASVPVKPRPNARTRGDDPGAAANPGAVALPLDATRLDTPAVDAPGGDALPLDATRVDAPAVDAPALDATRVDSPAVDAPALDATRVDTPAVRSDEGAAGGGTAPARSGAPHSASRPAGGAVATARGEAAPAALRADAASGTAAPGGASSSSPGAAASGPAVAEVSVSDEQASARDGKASARDGKASARDGKASARDGKVSAPDGEVSAPDTAVDAAAPAVATAIDGSSPATDRPTDVPASADVPASVAVPSGDDLAEATGTPVTVTDATTDQSARVDPPRPSAETPTSVTGVGSGAAVPSEPATAPAADGAPAPSSAASTGTNTTGIRPARSKIKGKAGRAKAAAATAKAAAATAKAAAAAKGQGTRAAAPKGAAATTRAGKVAAGTAAAEAAAVASPSGDAVAPTGHEAVASTDDDAVASTGTGAGAAAAAGGPIPVTRPTDDKVDQAAGAGGRPGSGTEPAGTAASSARAESSTSAAVAGSADTGPTAVAAPVEETSAPNRRIDSTGGGDAPAQRSPATMASAPSTSSKGRRAGAPVIAGTRASRTAVRTDALPADQSVSDVAPFSGAPIGPSRPPWRPMPVRAPSTGKAGLTILGTTLDRRQSAVLLGVVALVVLALAVFVPRAFGDDDRPPGDASGVTPTAAGSGAPAQAPAGPAAVPSAESPPASAAPTTPSPAPTTASAKPSPAAKPSSPPPYGRDVALPAGWRLHRDQTGFSVPVPGDWSVLRRGSEVYFSENGVSKRILIIDQTDKPRPDPVADWEDKERQRRTNNYRDYRRIKIESVPNYWDKAADWEFTRTSDGGNTLRTIKRGFVTAPDQAYGITWQGPASKWNEDQDDLRLIFAGFKPDHS